MQFINKKILACATGEKETKTVPPVEKTVDESMKYLLTAIKMQSARPDLNLFPNIEKVLEKVLSSSYHQTKYRSELGRLFIMAYERDASGPIASMLLSSNIKPLKYVERNSAVLSLPEKITPDFLTLVENTFYFDNPYFALKHYADETNADFSNVEIMKEFSDLTISRNPDITRDFSEKPVSLDSFGLRYNKQKGVELFARREFKKDVFLGTIYGPMTFIPISSDGTYCFSAGNLQIKLPQSADYLAFVYKETHPRATDNHLKKLNDYSVLKTPYRIKVGGLIPLSLSSNFQKLMHVPPDLVADTSCMVGIDQVDIGNFFRAINHSKNPNAVFLVIIINGSIHTGVFTERRIRKGEAIEVSYGTDDDFKNILDNWNYIDALMKEPDIDKGFKNAARLL